jgi:hypothetical protein
MPIGDEQVSMSIVRHQQFVVTWCARWNAEGMTCSRNAKGPIQ